MRKSVGKKSAIVASALLVLLVSVVYSHCQIPCGIYGDSGRFDMLEEHISTIEKSMKQISELSQEENPNFNQIVRWIHNKEKHAEEISHIVTYYFMAQRVKPVDKSKSKAYQEYVRKLTLLHEMLVYSMKAKQTSDLSHIEKLRGSLAEFQAIYFAQKAHGQSKAKA